MNEVNYLSYLSNGRWIEFVNKIGQSELGRFESIVRTIHDYKIKGKVIKFNGDIDYIDENTDWIPVSYEKQEELESMYTNDLQQRKRKEEDTALFKIKDLKVGYKVKVLSDNMTGYVSEIANNDKSAEIKVDDGVYRVINDNKDFTIIEWDAVPEYPDDTVNHPAHYTQGKVEVIEFIEQVTKDYNSNVAYHIGNAIKYLARSPHKNEIEDIQKAKWYLERAFENWDVK